MQGLFKNKYRIKSTRLQDWDYSKHGGYFVTVCIKDQNCCLGKVVKENDVKLSAIGERVKEIWLMMSEQFPCVYLDQFVIMPNHLHGILFITNDSPVETPFMASQKDAINHKDAINRVSTKGGVTDKYNSMLNKKSLSKIIRWFKGRSTYEIHKRQNDIHFAWQPRFYDHIIRNDQDLNRIREYIIYNPMKWAYDKENPDHISL